ncbi:FlgN protein [Clostridium cavendishii DSM 21758]|uniref:FlgN protein n=1 Tax=Clostridium cavendishii DSM 21758 TaxID=1121302 RepID=A0A1M6B4F2_9CLOT|nr:flagellar protein FlgN [Clostridium cavendishii]SHI43550.1 FlgN protein [Clostridium cavendishii DSM 21758]
MKEKLKEVIDNERLALIELLKLLDEQMVYITKNDVFALDAIVEKIKNSNKEVAQLEVERRKILNGKTIKEAIYELEDEELEKSYREIKKTVEEVVLQKESNDMLIKQQLSYTNQLLTFLNPNREVKTYNSYGKFK